MDEALVTCLMKHAEPLFSKECQTALDVTRALIHQMNTAPMTIIETAPLNATHNKATRTTKSKIPAQMDWKCPLGFRRPHDSGLGTSSSACCAPTPHLKGHPRSACIGRGGVWSLAALDGPHGGMQCCPSHAGISTSTFSHPIPKAARDAHAHAASLFQTFAHLESKTAQSTPSAFQNLSTSIHVADTHVLSSSPQNKFSEHTQEHHFFVYLSEIEGSTCWVLLAVLVVTATAGAFKTLRFASFASTREKKVLSGPVLDDGTLHRLNNLNLDDEYECVL